MRNFFNPQTLALTTAFLCYYPSCVNFRVGQIGLLIFLGVTMLWLFSRRRQEAAAGILLGILINIKLFLGLFILFFIVQRRWRLLCYCSGTLALIFLLGLWVFGAQVYSGFYQSLQGAAWFFPNWNASVYGYLFRLIALVGHGEPVALLILWVKTAYVIVDLITLIVLMRMTWPEEKLVQHYFDLGFCFTLSACLFLSPLGWNYYFPALLIAGYVILRLAPDFPRPAIIYLLTGLSLFLSALPGSLVKSPQKIGRFYSLTWTSKDFYALLLLMLVLVLLNRHLKDKLAIGKISAEKAIIKLQQYTYPLIIALAFFPVGIYGSCLAHFFYGR